MKIKTMNLSFYILFILSIGTIYLLAYITSDSHLNEHYATITITENHTIWEIAEENSDKHQLSTIEFVNWVEKHNRINANEVRIGDEVLVPIHKKKTNDSIVLVADGEFR